LKRFELPWQELAEDTYRSVFSQSKTALDISGLWLMVGVLLTFLGFGIFPQLTPEDVGGLEAYYAAPSVLGLFALLGLSIFASSYLEERHSQGKTYKMLSFLHGTLRIRETSIFRTQMILTGLFCAVVIHGIFNFIVTLPELLPGNPHELGDLWNGAPSFIANFPLLLFPSLVYVVGGFWLLTTLFMRTDAMKERGHLLRKEILADKDDSEGE